MLYDKILSHFGKVKINDAAFTQYEIVMQEVDKLCELTSQDWGLIHDPWFLKVRRGYFAGGCVCGLVICGALFYGYRAVTNAKKIIRGAPARGSFFFPLRLFLLEGDF